MVQSVQKELGDTRLLQYSLIKTVHHYLHTNLLYPGITSILVFQGKASDHLHLIDDAENGSDAQQNQSRLLETKKR